MRAQTRGPGVTTGHWGGFEGFNIRAKIRLVWEIGVGHSLRVDGVSSSIGFDINIAGRER